MWQLYGADKNAVCIFTTVDILENQLQRHDNIDTIILRDAKYVNHRSAKFDEDNLTPFLSKSLPFSFEKELRIVGFNSKIDLNRLDKNCLNGIEVKIKSLNELIDRIVIPPNSDSWFLESIENLCKKFQLDVKVKSSSLRVQRVEKLSDAMDKLQS